MRLVGEDEFSTIKIDVHRCTLAIRILQNRGRKRILHLFLDHPFQRPRPIGWVIPNRGNLIDRRLTDRQLQARLVKSIREDLQLQSNNFANFSLVKW